MNKNLLLKITNVILFLLFISQACSGLFHQLLSHELFEIVHEGGGIVLVIIALIHLLLNWGWVSVNFFRWREN